MIAEESSRMAECNLAGRTIVVTGAARGVGRVIAEACGRAGALVIIADILDREDAKQHVRLRPQAYQLATFL